MGWRGGGRQTLILSTWLPGNIVAVCVIVVVRCVCVCGRRVWWWWCCRCGRAGVCGEGGGGRGQEPCIDVSASIRGACAGARGGLGGCAGHQCAAAASCVQTSATPSRPA